MSAQSDGVNQRPAIISHAISIDLSELQFSRLFRLAVIAKKQTIITKKQKKKFLVDIAYGDQKLKGRVRIHGDLVDHIDIEAKRFSLDVKLKTGSINGFTDFKLMLPQTRPSEELVISEAFEEFGMPTLYRQFVDVSVNGVAYRALFVEKINRSFLERYGLRETNVWKADERLWWDAALRRKRNQAPHYPGNSYFRLANPEIVNISKEPFKSTDTYQPVLGQKHTIIGHALRGLTHLNKNFMLSSREKDFFCSLFKGCFFWDVLAKFSPHALLPNNLIIIQDILGDRMIPVFWDAGQSKKECEISDAKFERLKASVNSIEKSLRQKGHIPSTYDRCLIAKIIETYKNSDELQKTWQKHPEKGPNKKLPLTKVAWFDKNLGQTLICKTENIRSILHGVFHDCDPSTISHEELIKGLKGRLRHSGVPVAFLGAYPEKGDGNYFELETCNDTICELEISQPTKLKIPKELRLEKLILTLHRGGSLVIEKQKIQIDKVVMVSKAIDPSETKSLSNYVTGCLTFLDATLRVKTITLMGGFCEDQLNIINSDGTIAEIMANDAMSDAVDLDFSNVLIGKIDIKQAGNDCFDISRSTIEVETLLASQCGDKGISVGEQSNMEINNAIISRVALGVAVKDNSVLDIKNNVTVSKAEKCFATYLKKIEFNKPGRAQGRYSCE